MQLEIVLSESDVWAAATFPASTDGAKIAHLREEIGELIAEPGSSEEMADVLMILSHLLGAAGAAVFAAKLASMTTDEIAEAVAAKLAICRRRRWGTPDADGKVKAIKHAVREYESGWAVLSPIGDVVVGYLPNEGVAKSVALEYDDRPD